MQISAGDRSEKSAVFVRYRPRHRALRLWNGGGVAAGTTQNNCSRCILDVMAHGIPAARPATYDDVVNAPDHMVAEILDGRLYTTPRPALRHALAASALGVEIGGPFHHGTGGPGGWWILFEPELHLADDILVPDLAGWRREHLPTIPDAAFLTLAPDWACEVLSPSTERMDRLKKLRIYAREGVHHLWFVNPIQRTLEILRQAGSEWTLAATHGGSGVVHAEPFETVGLELTRLWPDPPPDPPDNGP